MAMVSDIEHLELDFHLHYKQLIKPTKDWIFSSIELNKDRTSSWCLQVNNVNDDHIGIYLTLVDGSPRSVQSYKIYIIDSSKSEQMMFLHRCTLQRDFPSNRFCWGFEKFLKRDNLKYYKKQIRDPKTKIIHFRCELNLIQNTESIILSPNDDHRLATDLFLTRTLDQWVDFLKLNNHFPELNNRVNEEIENSHR